MRFKFTSEDGKTEVVFNPKKSAERREMAAKIASGEIGEGKLEITIGHGKGVTRVLLNCYSVPLMCRKNKNVISELEAHERGFVVPDRRPTDPQG